MGAEWSKKRKYTITQGLFIIKFDTASELGVAAAEIWHHHGELIENPYDPGNYEFDKFNAAKWGRIEQLNNQKGA